LRLRFAIAKILGGCHGGAEPIRVIRQALGSCREEDPEKWRMELEMASFTSRLYFEAEGHGCAWKMRVVMFNHYGKE